MSWLHQLLSMLCLTLPELYQLLYNYFHYTLELLPPCMQTGIAISNHFLGPKYSNVAIFIEEGDKPLVININIIVLSP